MKPGPAPYKPDVAALLEQAAALVAKAVQALNNNRRAACQHCEAERFESWSEHVAFGQLEPIPQKLRTWAGSFRGSPSRAAS